MDQEAASAAVREGVRLAAGFRARISACRYQALIGLGQTTGWAGGHDSPPDPVPKHAKSLDLDLNGIPYLHSGDSARRSR